MTAMSMFGVVVFLSVAAFIYNVALGAYVRCFETSYYEFDDDDEYYEVETIIYR